MSNEQAQKALDRAKVALMSNPKSAFLVSVCLSLRHVWDSSIQTAQTNGKTIWYNPEFFVSLNADERLFLLMHETMHVALQHVLRLKKRNAKLWNVAADYVINLLLKKQGFSVIEGGLLDYKYDGMSTEEVYNLIKDNTPPQDFLCDIVEIDENLEEEKEALDDMLVKAQLYASMRGAHDSIPKELQMYLDTLLAPKLPWTSILSQYLSNKKYTTRTYKKPNRRFFPKDLLPSRFGKGLDHIAVVVDTSGSIMMSDFKRFVSEAYAILSNMQPKTMDLIQFDYCIRAVDRLKTVEDFENISFSGRGGTLINEVIEWANQNTPDVMVIFTDGYFPPINFKCSVPVIWIIHNSDSFNAPFGQTIYFKE